MSTKDEILKEKFHETCILSEYYLSILLSNTNISSYALSKEYSKRLRDLVTKYDRLLEVYELEIKQKQRADDEAKEQKLIRRSGKLQRTISSTTITIPHSQFIKKSQTMQFAQKQQTIAKPFCYTIKYDSDDDTDNETTDDDDDDRSEPIIGVYDDDERLAAADYEGECTDSSDRQVSIGKSMSNLSKDSGYSDLLHGHLTSSYMSSINDEEDGEEEAVDENSCSENILQTSSTSTCSTTTCSTHDLTLPKPTTPTPIPPVFNSYKNFTSTNCVKPSYMAKNRFISDIINEDELYLNDSYSSLSSQQQNDSINEDKFRFNTDSLMNMSMIENIEIKNNNSSLMDISDDGLMSGSKQFSNFDMNSSILIFN